MTIIIFQSSDLGCPYWRSIISNTSITKAPIQITIHIKEQIIKSHHYWLLEKVEKKSKNKSRVAQSNYVNWENWSAPQDQEKADPPNFLKKI